MSFTYGFYNSINHDRLYDAIQVSKIFDGIIRDGVYATIGEAFIVREDPAPNMVVVSTGRAWFNHTWNENDGYLDVELPPPESVVDRIDAIVLDVYSRPSLDGRHNQILVVKGTPSSTPQNPTLIREPEHNQYPLCYIRRIANEPKVSQSQITNAVGSTECPFVTGVLETLDINMLLLQWQAAWPEFLQECRDHLDEWEEPMKEDLANFVLEFKRQCDEFLAAKKSEINAFEDDFKEYTEINKQEWEAWVAELKDILDENTAGHLLLEIEKINEYLEETIGGSLKPSIFLMDIEYIPKTTQFIDDTHIKETFETGYTNNIEFLANGNITETYKDASGATKAIHRTVFNADGSIKEEVDSIELVDFFLSMYTGVGIYINIRYGLDMTISAAGKYQTLEQVLESSEMATKIYANQRAREAILSSPSAYRVIRDSGDAREQINASNDAMKVMLTEHWVYTVNEPQFLSNIINNRDLLHFIFFNGDMRNYFMSNQLLMGELTGKSTLKQFGFIAGSVEAASTPKRIWIKDSAIALFPQYDIHNYNGAILFDHLEDGSKDDVPSYSYVCEATIYPHGPSNADDAQHFEWDMSKTAEIESPFFVAINRTDTTDAQQMACGDYICKGTDGSSYRGFTIMATCIAF